jgi:hypothetical protein
MPLGLHVCIHRNLSVWGSPAGATFGEGTKNGARKNSEILSSPGCFVKQEHAFRMRCIRNFVLKILQSGASERQRAQTRPFCAHSIGSLGPLRGKAMKFESFETDPLGF